MTVTEDGVNYHVNPFTWRVGVCRVVSGVCPFGGDSGSDNHFESKEQAQSELDRRLENKKSLAATRSGGFVPMKIMDSNDLADEIMDRSSELGIDENVSEILEFASILHAGQKRRNRAQHITTPYIEHPMRGMLRLMRCGVTHPPILYAALLHDTEEDCAKKFVARRHGSKLSRRQIELMDENECRAELSEYIGKRWGSETSELVHSVTNDHVPDEVGREMTLQDKTDRYVAKVREEIASSPATLLIKFVGDYVDNAGSLHHTDLPGSEAKTFKQAFKYLPCVDAFIDELEKPNPYISEKSRQRCLDQANRIKYRLEGLVSKYEDHALVAA